jgi:hypothetical protein
MGRKRPGAFGSSTTIADMIAQEVCVISSPLSPGAMNDKLPPSEHMRHFQSRAVLSAAAHDQTSTLIAGVITPDSCPF